MKDSLYKRLMSYVDEGYVPMHMPGAKRNADLVDMPNPYAFDITEVEGFDNLHNAEDILREEMNRAARMYSADDSLLLVNGSSAGVIAAISGVCNEGDKVLISRNCHISVYNALISRKLDPVFLYPDLYDDKSGIVDAAYVDEDLFINNPGIKAVVITSPTYEGIVSDITAIAETAHKYGAVLIVDGAHGAHLPFHDLFPDSAIKKGADIVITSLHKTMPAFTSAALMLFKKTDKVIVSGYESKIENISDDKFQNDAHFTEVNTEYKYRFNMDRVKFFWNFMQTTSPSYLLMGSISACLDLIEERGEELFKEYTDRLIKMRRRLLKLKNIRMLTCAFDYETGAYDQSKNVDLAECSMNKILPSEMCGVSDIHTSEMCDMSKIRPSEIHGVSKILPSEMYDMSKIVLICENGTALYDILREEYKIQLEMSSYRYALAMTSIGDTDEYYERFCSALEEIDERITSLKCDDSSQEIQNNIAPKNTEMLPFEAMDIYLNGEYELIDINDAAGKIDCENVCCYPPGIPEIIPGEIWDEDGIANIVNAVDQGLEVLGIYLESDTEDSRKIRVKVLKDRI